MNIKWDSGKYTSDFSFVHEYGNSVIELIEAEKGASVLDLGCGNGALTKVLQDKGYCAKGLDASPELLTIARGNYPHIEFIQADAADFSLEEPVDAVFSNAVLHWIDKAWQPRMLACVHRALKPGGEFVFEFGGHGNNRQIHTALAEIFAAHEYPYQMPFYFPTIGEYAALLETAGFQVRYAVLFDRPTALKGEDGLKDWIRLFVKTPFAVLQDEQKKEAILAETEKSLRGGLYQDGIWYADYVRLRMKAVRLK